MKQQARRTGPIWGALLGCLRIACFGMAALCWLGCEQADMSQEAAAPTGAAGQPRRTAAGQQPAPLAVLESMVKAYRNATTYADNGQMRMAGFVDNRPFEMESPYLVAMARPNKLRMQVHQGMLVSDGRQMWGAIATLRNQVLRRDAPAELALESIFFDHLLTAAMGQGASQVFSWVPLQQVLLLADDPLKTLLFQTDRLQLLEPAAIDQHTCYRVEADRPDGKAVFWIDQESYVLRRFEFPSDQLRELIAGGRAEEFALVVDFANARFDANIDPNAFKFQAPPDADFVESFLSPDAALLGKPARQFTFVDLDGNQITPDSLDGKVAVLDFWASWCGPCRESLPILETVYQQYRDNDKLAFVAVSVDNSEDSPTGPRVEDEALKKTFAEWKVSVPIARDPQQCAARAFNISSIPTTVLLGPKGNVQDLETGVSPDLETALSDKLEQLLAGKDIYRKKLDLYAVRSKERQQRFERWTKERINDGSYAGPLTFDQVAPTTEIARRTEPESLKLNRLWSCRQLQGPGNILVVEAADGPPRLLVLDGGNSIAEVGPDGSVMATHDLPVQQSGPVTFLRTAVDADGRRFYVGAANGGQQLHLLGEDFKPVLAFPESAPENPHAGIADLQFGDLDGDGTPEICVGYWGVVGVQGVSLEGRRIWFNRTLSTVLRLAILGPDADDHRRLLCTNDLGTLIILDARGERQGEITVPDRPIHWIVAADLDGDDQPELCGLSPSEEGSFTAVGLNLQGEVLWSYPLPRGVHRHPIDAVLAGRLLADGPGQWLVGAADGSIHVIAADGKLVDRFNYGAPLTGLATTQLDGRPVLLVSTPEALDAWQVESRQQQRPTK